MPVQLGLGVAWVVLHASQSTFRVAVAAAAVASGLIAGLPTYLAQQGAIPAADWYYAADGVLALVGIAATALVGRRSKPETNRGGTWFRPVGRAGSRRDLDRRETSTGAAAATSAAASEEGGHGEVGEHG